MAILVSAGAVAAAEWPDGVFKATYAGMAAAGAFAGAVLFVAVQLLIFELTATLFHWSCRLPKDVERTWGEFLTTASSSLAVYAAVGALVFAICHAVAPAPYGLVICLVPFFVSLLPLYQTCVLPWLQYARAPTLPENLSELDAWIDEIRIEQDLPRVQIRVQRGSAPTAFAMGGLGTHLVVIGKGLLDGLTTPHLQAIIAHEIAHVARRDVLRRLLPLTIVGGTLHAGSVVAVSHPLFATNEVWGVTGGALAAGLFAAIFMAFLPGFFMRRMEFQADRLAAKLLGNGEPLAQALERLCEISGQRLDQWTWSHPPLQARITALRSASV
ncbi:MAG: M48 family metalloprotease [Gammaproteobacteria bacterium]|nr:M48 family metalloprotease [Gammaproteobacteria bacterium]